VKPKVAHVTTVAMSVRHLLLNQLQALGDAGFDVTAISASGPDIEYVSSAGVRHVPVGFTRRISPLRDLRAAWELWRIFRRESFTIVHTHQVKAAVIAQFVARLAGVPVVVNTLHGFYFHEHTPPVKRRLWVTLEKWCARWSDLILSQNREDIPTALNARICSRERIEHLGNGIDVRRFDPAALDERRVAAARRELALPDDALVVGFVGRFVEEKGVLDLFAAVRALRPRYPSLRLLMVGLVDRDKADAVTPDVAARYGIDDLTVFAGYRHDMPAMYGLMHVAVLPSHREGMPRAPMEASAMRVPCVASDVRGCREVVRSGVNGILVPVRDSQRLAEALDRLLADEPLRRRLGNGGRDVAVAEFDERQVFARTIDAYARLLQRRGLPVPLAHDRPAMSTPV
jgi:glycosyltransferase involved in cell wall biosynthesis